MSFHLKTPFLYQRNNVDAAKINFYYEKIEAIFLSLFIFLTEEAFFIS